MSEADSSIKSWVPIVGRWSVSAEEVQYLGPQPGSPQPFGICLSDTDLTDGSISAHIRISPQGEGRFLFGYRSPTERYITAGLGGWGFAYTIGEFEPAVGWRSLAVAGSAENLSFERSYEVSLAISGQRITLTIDRVRVLDHVLDKPLTGGQVGVFAWGIGPTEGEPAADFSKISIDRQPGTVFVVMEFSEPYRQLYEEVIQPEALRFGLRAYHVGEVFGPGMILHDIAQGIVDAKVVIAEITPTNQNVFYELGYAHALGKPTILLAERGRQLPFDISGYRVLFYDNTIAGKKQVQDGLSKHLKAILRD